MEDREYLRDKTLGKGYPRMRRQHEAKSVGRRAGLCLSKSRWSTWLAEGRREAGEVNRARWQKVVKLGQGEWTLFCGQQRAKGLGWP